MQNGEMARRLLADDVALRRRRLVNKFTIAELAAANSLVNLLYHWRTKQCGSKD
jgi:hypothetical protein